MNPAAGLQSIGFGCPDNDDVATCLHGSDGAVSEEQYVASGRNVAAGGTFLDDDATKCRDVSGFCVGTKDDLVASAQVIPYVTSRTEEHAAFMVKGALNDGSSADVEGAIALRVQGRDDGAGFYEVAVFGSVDTFCIPSHKIGEKGEEKGGVEN